MRAPGSRVGLTFCASPPCCDRLLLGERPPRTQATHGDPAFGSGELIKVPSTLTQRDPGCIAQQLCSLQAWQGQCFWNSLEPSSRCPFTWVRLVPCVPRAWRQPESPWGGRWSEQRCRPPAPPLSSTQSPRGPLWRTAGRSPGGRTEPRGPAPPPLPR